MFVVYRLVNGHPQYRSKDIRNTVLGPIFKKISCVLGSSAILDSTDVFSPCPKTYASALGNTVYYYCYNSFTNFLVGIS